MSVKVNISIIICSRNRPSKLKRCIEAINSEEMIAVNGELILVNNSSTDNTSAVMQSFAKEAPFPTTLVYEPNIGLGYARNAGLRKATGRIIVFFDDDCYLARGYLPKVADLFKAERFYYCSGSVLRYDEKDNKIGTMHLSELEIYNPFRFIAAGCFRGANMVFLRKVIDAIGPFDIMLGAGTRFPCEDVDYAARASWAGFTGCVTPELVVYHHGRRSAKDVATTKAGYDYGRGAYYMKYILQGKFIYLVEWVNRSRRNKKQLIREAKAAFLYLLERIKFFFKKSVYLGPIL